MHKAGDRRKQRIRLSIGAGVLGALVAAFTLFAGVLPAAASGGSGAFTMGTGSVNVAAGSANNTITFTPSSVTGSTGGVCFEPAVTGGDSGYVTFSPATVTVPNSSTSTQTLHYSVQPNAPGGQAFVTLIGCNSSSVSGTGSPTSTTINITAAGAGVPVLLSINPSHGPTGTLVAFTLAASVPVTSVSFGSQQVSQNLTSSSFQVAAPAGSGTVNVTVTNNAGSTTLANAFTYDPAVIGVSPSSGPVGQSVTISGSNFTGVTGVFFGGTPASATFVNDSTITAFAPPGHSLGDIVHVVVTTTTGTSPTTPADEFTYAATAGPTITGVTGSCTIAGGTTIAVTGTGFVVGATATIGGNAANINVTDANDATVICPAQGSVGQYPLMITVNSQATNAFQVTYAAAAAPTVTSVVPNSGPLAGGNSVTVNGTNFQTSGLAVTFGPNAATCSSVTATSMSCVAPGHAAGTVDITVSVNSVASANTSADNYTYTGTPVITSISPTSGPTGTTVVVTGFNFTGTTAVKFGTTVVATSDVTISSDTSLSVVVPDSLAANDYDIIITNLSGTSATSTADVFTVTTGDIASLTLRGTFTLIGWVGKDGMPVGDALKGGASGPHDGTNDITSSVSVIWGFNTLTQTFQGYFPSAANVPGANDLTTLTFGVGYFVGLTNPSAGTVVWKVEVGSQS